MSAAALSPPLGPSDPLDPSSHPLGFVQALARRYGPGLELSFARYRYAPQTIADERERFTLPAESVTREWLAGQLAALRPDESLALESAVSVRGRRRHIAMLDLDGGEPGKLSALIKGLAAHTPQSAFYYFSGRSCHAYFPRLLSATAWTRFMGAALLCNLPGEPPAVDARWIGHRLLGGRSALRWSGASSHYQATPRRASAEDLERGAAPQPQGLQSPAGSRAGP